jgi:hypothetical protein
MTNFEKIKQMNAKEMVDLFGISTCKNCYYAKECIGFCESNCKKGFEKWLESEADND